MKTIKFMILLILMTIYFSCNDENNEYKEFRNNIEHLYTFDYCKEIDNYMTNNDTFDNKKFFKYLEKNNSEILKYYKSKNFYFQFEAVDHHIDKSQIIVFVSYKKENLNFEYKDLEMKQLKEDNFKGFNFYQTAMCFENGNRAPDISPTSK